MNSVGWQLWSDPVAFLLPLYLERATQMENIKDIVVATIRMIEVQKLQGCIPTGFLLELEDENELTDLTLVQIRMAIQEQPGYERGTKGAQP